MKSQELLKEIPENLHDYVLLSKVLVDCEIYDDENGEYKVELKLINDSNKAYWDKNNWLRYDIVSTEINSKIQKARLYKQIYK